MVMVREAGGSSVDGDSISGDEAAWMRQAAADARAASRALAAAPTEIRNHALHRMAACLRADASTILAANEADLAEASGSAAFRDRLALSPARLEAMAAALNAMAALPDPLDRVLADWTRPNGLRIRRIPQPVGVIGMIYESRPNVGADAAGLCLKSGNAVILRGGSESHRSARAINGALVRGVRQADLPASAIQVAPGPGRGYVAAMLGAAGLVDLIIPRGGRGLVERVQLEARVPVLAHAEGLCHTYLHADAELSMARRVVANAKMRRTGICGATETLLCDLAAAPTLLPPIVEDLRTLGCAFRADPQACAFVPGLPEAGPGDFDREWLDAVLSIAVVRDMDAALAHIARHGSGHTDAIVTANPDAAERFLRSVDSAVAMWNASTQFCDGGEFGLGGEIGIATGRIHARGPVGLEQLTTYRYLVTGEGQVRP